MQKSVKEMRTGKAVALDGCVAECLESGEGTVAH